jgi:hypothetical protein
VEVAEGGEGQSPESPSSEQQHVNLKGQAFWYLFNTY